MINQKLKSIPKGRIPLQPVDFLGQTKSPVHQSLQIADLKSKLNGLVHVFHETLDSNFGRFFRFLDIVYFDKNEVYEYLEEVT